MEADRRGRRCREREDLEAEAGQFGGKWFSVERRHPEEVSLPQARRRRRSHRLDRAGSRFDSERLVARGRKLLEISGRACLDRQEQRRREARAHRRCRVSRRRFPLLPTIRK
jgi:hypothetical protein